MTRQEIIEALHQVPEYQPLLDRALEILSQPVVFVPASDGGYKFLVVFGRRVVDGQICYDARKTIYAATAGEKGINGIKHELASAAYDTIREESWETLNQIHQLHSEVTKLEFSLSFSKDISEHCPPELALKVVKELQTWLLNGSFVENNKKVELNKLYYPLVGCVRAGNTNEQILSAVQKLLAEIQTPEPEFAQSMVSGFDKKENAELEKLRNWSGDVECAGK